MFGSRSLALAALVGSMMSLAANAAVIGMLYVGPENKAGLAVEKTTTGDVLLLLDMNGNGQRVEFGVSPGTPFGGGTVVISPSGEPMAVLSIYSGEKQGMVNSENVSIIDGASERSHQRSNLSQDLRDLAQAGYLRDEKGKIYSAAEIKEVSLVFQVRDSSGFETTLSLGNFKIAELQTGTVKQLAGEAVAAKPVTKVDAITQNINNDLRASEIISRHEANKKPR